MAAIYKDGNSNKIRILAHLQRTINVSRNTFSSTNNHYNPHVSVHTAADERPSVPDDNGSLFYPPAFTPFLLLFIMFIV